MRQKSIGIVVSKFNEEITSQMLASAKQEAKALKLKISEIVFVSGAFEIPFATKQLLAKKEITAVATLGAVIKGGTGHDQVIAHAVAKKILDLSLELNKPVSLGIIGPNATLSQAKERAVPYAQRAVQAVLGMMMEK